MTVDIILFKSKKVGKDKHPLVLRLTEKGKRKYKTLGNEYQYTKDEWDFGRNKPKKDKDNNVESFILKTKTKYLEKIKELKSEGKEFTMDSLIEMVENPSKKVKVFEYFDQRIKYYVSTGKVGNVAIYKGAKSYLESFHKNDMYFSEINYSFLTKYEAHLRKKGLKDTTISIQMRTLRALYNEAIKDESVNASRDNYPFEKFSISQRFDTDTSKRALSEKELRKVLELNLPEEDPLFEAWHYFRFGYFAIGINFVDIANLRWIDCDFENEIITYQRQKKKKKKTTRIPMLPQVREILLYQKQFSNSFNKMNYVFPILNKDFHKTPIQKKNRVHKVITRINQDLKKIGNKAGIETRLTTYVWRHSMASELQRKGVSVDTIKELMHHKNTAVTETYLQGLSEDVKRTAAMNL